MLKILDNVLNISLGLTDTLSIIINQFDHNFHQTFLNFVLISTSKNLHLSDIFVEIVFLLE